MLQLSFDRPWALALLALAVPLLCMQLWAVRERLQPLALLARLRGRAALELGLRLATLGCLVLAAAGPRLSLPARHLAVVFAADQSDSVARTAPSQAAGWIAQVAAQKPSGDSAGLVVFGRDAAVAAGLGQNIAAARAPAVDGQATDIGQAIRLAGSLVPAGAAGRIVLLSDGRETSGDAVQQAEQAHAAGLEVDVVPAGAAAPEVEARGLVAPQGLRPGERFAVNLALAANIPTEVLVRLLTDGTVSQEQQVSLQPGNTTLTWQHEQLAAGRHTLTLQVQPQQDTFGENNRIDLPLDVKAAPRALVVEGSAGDGQYLADALQTEGLTVIRQPASAVSLTTAALAPFDAVVLANVPSSALNSDQIGALSWYVKQLAGVLAVTGGDQAFGAGGYAQSALDDLLPVSSISRPRRITPSVALDLVIDRSGSMYGDKIDAAKQAARLAVGSLQPGDEVGVLAFDDQHDWVAPRTPLDSKQQADQVLAGVNQIQARGSTDIFGALQAAGADMSTSDARLKHIALLTDGQASNQDDTVGLARQLNSQGVTISTVAIGADADVAGLQDVARAGGGQSYVAQTPDQVPGLVFEDTRLVAPPAVFEGLLSTSLTRAGQARGLSAGMPLRGYDPTVAKPAAQVDIENNNGDPLLAEWRLGLGQVLAWTSDVRNRWAAGWVGGASFGDFWSQALRNALPGRIDGSLQAAVALSDAGAQLTVTAAPGVTPRQATVVLPAGASQDLSLEQTAPGVYQANLPAAQQGSYVVDIVGQAAGGAVVAATASYAAGWPAEYLDLGPDMPKLAAIAAAGGGALLTNPAQAFTRDAWSSRQYEIWTGLVMAALLLFLLEMAVRRFGHLIGRWREQRRTRTPDIISIMRALDDARAHSGGFASRDRLLAASRQARPPAHRPKPT